MPLLDRFTGPPCARCGCTDSEVISEPKLIDSARDGQPPWPVPGMAKCNHCGYKFGFQEEAKEEEAERPRYPAPLKCPDCQSERVFVYSSPKPQGTSPRVRYHKCRDCQKTFKTVPEQLSILRAG